MLVNAGYKKGDGITLITNQMVEIVGRFVEEDNDTITLSTALMVIVQPQNDGQLGMALQQLSYSDDPDSGDTVNYTFQKSQLLTKPNRARKDIEDQLRTRESGIDLGGK